MSIDYGMGIANVHPETGVHYGVISQNSILQAWADSSESVYPEFDEDYYDVEPIGFEFSGDGYEMTTCLDSAVMVLKSPFYTYAPFCSPCVPGAGNLDQAADMFEMDIGDGAALGIVCGIETYCCGHDWFDDGVAPYPVFSVATGYPVFPDAWYGRNMDLERGRSYGPYWYGWDMLRMPAGAVPSDYCA